MPLNESTTKAYMVMSPFYLSGYTPIRTYVKLLLMHVLWHQQQGVAQHVVYVEERLASFVHDKDVQTLVRSGQLLVVLWTDISRHEFGPHNKTHVDKYLMQTIIYNHAALALWGTDSLALFFDVDEYLMTPRPMTAVQAFIECGAQSEPMGIPTAGLQLVRRTALCQPGGPVSGLQCTPGEAYVRSWDRLDPALVQAGKQPHPMLAIAVSHNTTRKNPDVKTILDPNLILSNNVHLMYPLPSTGRKHPLETCVAVAHLVDLLRWRDGAPNADASLADWTFWGREMWWPVARLLNSSQQ